MRYSDDDLTDIFDRSSGRCHLCHGGLAFTNYGQLGERGAWEVEHSVARANGGSDLLNNLYAAHIRCNRSKGRRTTRTARGWHGKTRAPLSPGRREAARTANAAGAGLAIGLLARAVWPQGWLLAGLVAAIIGYDQDPDR